MSPRARPFAVILFALMMSATAGSAVAAAQGLNLGRHDAEAQISVTADRFSGDLKTKVGTYSGNVIVSQGNFKLHADEVRVAVANGKPDKIIATGHVLFDAPSGAASGQRGIYELGQHTVKLTGNVILTKNKDVMRGTSLVVNLDTGQATLGAKGLPGGRVQGVFSPPKRSDSSGKK